MKIASWNVNGIRAVWSKGLFEAYVSQHRPDILCLQETKAQPDQSPVDLPEYIEIWNSAERKGYSGTAIFSKIKPLSIINDFPTSIADRYQFGDKFGDSSKEGRVLTAEFEKFFLVTVYTPNSKDNLERLEHRHNVWDPAFLEHCVKLQKIKPVVFCGDFNVAHQEIDLARPKENVGKHGFTPEERAGFDQMLAAGFIDTFRHMYPDKKDVYSWWTNWGGARQRNVGWRIDYFMISEDLLPALKDSRVLSEVLGSDHAPVEIDLEI